MVDRKKFASYRKKSGFTQQSLATKVGVSENMIGMTERGVKVPSVRLLKEMADLFGCTIDELIKQ